MENLSYSEIFKSLPVAQQQQLSNVQPELAASYLYSLQNLHSTSTASSSSTHNNKKKKRSNDDSGNQLSSTNNQNTASAASSSSSLTSASIAELAVKKRRKGSDPRKCYNESCDRIVTKRNYCYKCQKRKERGLALNSKLPSIKQLLLPSEKKQRSKKQPNNSTPKSPSSSDPPSHHLHPSPQLGLLIHEPAMISNSPSSSSSSSSSSKLVDGSNHAPQNALFNFSLIPNIKETINNPPNYFETVLSSFVNERNNNQQQTSIFPDLSSSSLLSSLSPSTQQTAPVQTSHSSSAAYLNPLNQNMSSSHSSPQIENIEISQKMQNLHEYLLQLSGGSEDKAATILNQYLSSRLLQPPTSPPDNAVPLYNPTSPFATQKPTQSANFSVPSPSNQSVDYLFSMKLNNLFPNHAPNNINHHLHHHHHHLDVSNQPQNSQQQTGNRMRFF